MQERKLRYIGETKQILKFRLADHRGYMNNGDDTATGEHFNSPGHSISDLNITILQKVKKKDDLYRNQKIQYILQRNRQQ